jgi:hypothetical protein
MSIVISVIEKNKKFYIASDKRGKRVDIIKDNYKKIYQLSKELYFGMTGIYEAGLSFFEHIKNFDTKNIDSLIENIDYSFDNFFKNDKPEKLAIMIGGKDNSGGFFIWLKNIQGETKFIKGSGNIEYAVISNDKIEIFSKYFKEQIELRMSVRNAIIETIAYASRIDSSISKTYELRNL